MSDSTPPPSEPPPPGLPAFNRARRRARERGRGGTFGSRAFWLWSVTFVAALAIVYWKRQQSEVEAHRARLLARQRALEADLGPLFYPLRERFERWTTETARADWADEAPAGGAEAVRALLEKPGVYLRLPAPDARTNDAIRQAAPSSLKDLFVAGLLRAPAADPRRGKACASTRECAAGEVCNEAGYCAVPEQPYNLRVAYRGARALSETWVHEVEVAQEPLRLRMYENDLDAALAADLPVAVDLLKRAQYFLVVVDEVPPGLARAPGQGLAEAVQAAPHAARVALYEVPRERRVFRSRHELDADLQTSASPEGRDAQRRQVLNAELAQKVRAALGL
ncbi:MAG TPA: hypothetical protein VFS43_02970 [Polyangiaceae bacterium]|nr:hypothetical protein [Polyangiaceae bacterium]